MLTFQALRNRRTGFWLAVFSVAVSVVLLVGIDRLRKDVRAHFLQTVSRTDLIVAAPGGDIGILLGVIFHEGDDRTRIRWSDYEKVSRMPEVAWSVPVALGDSLHGFDVVGTDPGYFTHYRYAGGRSLSFAEGGNFKQFYDAVVGSEAAKRLHLRAGDTIVLSHGHGEHAHRHANRPFHVAGILAPSLTPADRTVFVRLDALEAIHVEWRSGRYVDMHLSAEDLEKLHVTPEHLSGMLLGLKNRADVLAVERKINDSPDLKLRAVIPAKALAELWRLLSQVETVLFFIAGAVFFAALLGIVSTLLATLGERRREMAVLRALGAGPSQVFLLFALEALITVAAGIVLGVVLLELLLFGVSQAGMAVPVSYGIDGGEAALLALLLVAALAAGSVPAFGAYRHSLKDGMTVRM